MVDPQHDGGPPPPPWQREARRRDRWIVAATAAAAIVLGVPLGLVAWNLSETVTAADATPPATGAPDGGDDGGDDGSGGDPPVARDEVEVPELDLDALEGTDAVYGQLLTDVDRAERAMIAAQDDIAAVFGSVGPDGDPDELTDGLSGAAGDGQRELQELRGELATPVDDAAVRELRDAYLAHLDAWVRFLVAIERTPTILGTEDGTASYDLAIDTTGDDFADLLEDLPTSVDDDVRALADAIIERGFPDVQPDPDDTI